MKKWDDADIAGILNPRFRDGTDRTKLVQYDLSAMSTAHANVVPWNNTGMSDSSVARTELTITTTGNIDDLDLTSGIAAASTLRMNNATAATLRGMQDGVAGKTVFIQSIGAGNVTLANQNVGSAANNRLITGINADIILAGSVGFAFLVYDATTNRWRVASFEPGSWLAYTPVWSANGTAPSLGNGTLTGSYYRNGNMVFYHITLTAGTTTTFGTLAWLFSVPFTPGTPRGGTAWASHAGGTAFPGVVLFSGSNIVVVNVNTYMQSNAPFTWASTDTLNIDGWFGI